MNATNLPELNGNYGVPVELAAQFRRDGHVLLRGVASAGEMAVYRGVILAARE